MVTPYTIVGAASLSAALRPTASVSARTLVVAMLVASLLGGLTAYPYFLHYRNEVSGGRRTAARLADHTAGGDAGQDFGALRDWLYNRPTANPIGLACRTMIDPLVYGINYVVAPIPTAGPLNPRDVPWFSPQGAPEPGLFAVDAYNLGTPQYAYFRELEPVAKIGGSILVYYISEGAAAAARQRVDLSALGDESHGQRRDFLQRRYRDPTGRDYEYAILLPSSSGVGPWPAILFLHGFDERSGAHEGTYTLTSHFPTQQDDDRIFPSSQLYRRAGQASGLRAVPTPKWPSRYWNVFVANTMSIAAVSLFQGCQVGQPVCGPSLLLDPIFGPRSSQWQPPHAIRSLHAL